MLDSDCYFNTFAALYIFLFIHNYFVYVNNNFNSFNLLVQMIIIIIIVCCVEDFNRFLIESAS